MPPFVPQPPPTAQVIDWASLVAGSDATWKDPPVVYIWPNGRKFVEFPTDGKVFAGTVYDSDDGTAFYSASHDPMTLYATE